VEKQLGNRVGTTAEEMALDQVVVAAEEVQPIFEIPVVQN
jgi:hypothetical protein